MPSNHASKPDRDPAAPRRLSVVVPMYNEAQGVETFFAALLPVLEPLDLELEVVCVNDGSRDDTLARLRDAAAADRRIRIVDLARNFGKENALTAGLDHCTGDAIVFVDADLQDPPELIPRFVARWREGYDVVYGVRSWRAADTPLKRFTAGAFYRVFNLVSRVPIPEQTGDFRLIDRRVADALRRLPERNRFMKGLFAWVGFRQVGIPYERPARARGESSWSLWKLWNFALDGITGFTTAPLRIWSYVGALVALAAFAYGTFLILYTLVTGGDVPGFASLMVAVLFLGGVQLISLGVLGEYLGRLYQESKGRPLYLVDRTYGFDQADTGPDET
jgi:glycosyltransferase involved in cell wall biosynthesis